MVPIVTDMIKCFIDRREAYQIRILAYKRFYAPLPLAVPKLLRLRFLDRRTPTRGIKNQEEVIQALRDYNGVSVVAKCERRPRSRSR